MNWDWLSTGLGLKSQVQTAVQQAKVQQAKATTFTRVPVAAPLASKPAVLDYSGYQVTPQQKKADCKCRGGIWHQCQPGNDDGVVSQGWCQAGTDTGKGYDIVRQACMPRPDYVGPITAADLSEASTVIDPCGSNYYTAETQNLAFRQFELLRNPWTWVLVAAAAGAVVVLWRQYKKTKT